MGKDRWFAEEFERHRRAFEDAGDFAAVMEALRLACWNSRALPEWLATMVIDIVDREFTREGSIGGGKQGNWSAKHDAMKIADIRVQWCEMHFRARKQYGRGKASGLAKILGYGTEVPGQPFNLVTNDQIFEVVSKQLRGKPAQGSPEAIAAAWKGRKRQPGVRRGGE